MPFDTESDGSVVQIESGDGHVAPSKSELEQLTDALTAMAPPGVAVGVRAISAADATRLDPAERSITAAMAEVRRTEFASGRLLLRDLLESDEPILREANGAPDFATGVVGSLTHDRHVAAAAVTRRPDVHSIGVDIEPIGAGPLTADEATIIVREDDHVPDPLAAFVMKEATYKAWSQLGGEMLDHHDVRVDCAGGAFESTVLRAGHPSALLHRYSGLLRHTTRHWVALVMVFGALDA